MTKRKRSQSMYNLVAMLTKYRYQPILDSIMRVLSPRDATRAIRILEWLAYTFRPLKISEIQDGITFSTKGIVQGNETKLGESIIDLCRPLIEEGPGNTVEFVHFSAKEYVLTLYE